MKKHALALASLFSIFYSMLPEVGAAEIDGWLEYKFGMSIDHISKLTKSTIGTMHCQEKFAKHITPGESCEHIEVKLAPQEMFDLAYFKFDTNKNLKRILLMKTKANLSDFEYIAKLLQEKYGSGDRSATHDVNFGNCEKALAAWKNDEAVYLGDFMYTSRYYKVEIKRRFSGVSASLPITAPCPTMPDSFTEQDRSLLSIRNLVVEYYRD